MRARGGQQRNEVREIVLEYGTLHRALRLDFLLEYGKGPTEGWMDEFYCWIEWNGWVELDGMELHERGWIAIGKR